MQTNFQSNEQNLKFAPLSKNNKFINATPIPFVNSNKIDKSESNSEKNPSSNELNKKNGSS
jgi:hypothetical protein